MTPIPVQRIRRFLESEFTTHIDVEDLRKRPEHEREQKLYSRCLAALAVRELTGCDSGQAAMAVIDDFADKGIDAIGVDEDTSRLWLIQAKWSDKGRAGVSEEAAHKLLYGLELILNNELSAFNDRFQDFADRVRNVVNSYDMKIDLVFAVTGSNDFSVSVRDILNRRCLELNSGQPIVSYTKLGIEELHEIVRQGVQARKVNVDVLLEQAALLDDPHKAYYGTVPAHIIAEWYDQHKDALFDKNIRHSLGVTKVNRDIAATLKKSPQEFWYFNNGITVLCDALSRSGLYAGRTNGPVTLRAEGASVVNGAQTVTGIHAAIQESPDVVTEARVLVRLISLENCPPGFAAEITRATNTQNVVVEQDFIALDQVQERLALDFALDLQKNYVVKRGAPEPAADDGCGVGEAAEALACADDDARMVFRAKRDRELLWEEQTYSSIFPGNVSARRVWNCVRVLRSIKDELARKKNQWEGRAQLVSSHGDLVIAHLVFQKLGSAVLEDAGGAVWAQALASIPGLVEDFLKLLVHLVDRMRSKVPAVSAIFSDLNLCRSLVEQAKETMNMGGQIPVLPDEYLPRSRRKGRRSPNAVVAIIDSRYLADGTPLEFKPVTGPEQRHLAGWLAEDPRRGKATWVNHRSKPILWAADETQYSPSGLVMHMLSNVAGNSIKAVQGTTRWVVPAEGSLREIADRIRSTQSEAPD
ncbi:AIPR family protein [Saccharopolyspora hattusasensis]|uniref:AIPR family protein n=1 Tax=Saccharopolyspora hattusasensis TaxID=1128679 RepID=UPI003D99CC1B